MDQHARLRFGFQGIADPARMLFREPRNLQSIESSGRDLLRRHRRRQSVQKLGVGLGHVRPAPVGRVGTGEDIARQILALMTIGFATGSIVYIDGGALIT